MSAKIQKLNDGSYDIHFGGASLLNTRGKDEAEAKCNYLNGGDGLTKRERFAMAAMQGIQAQNFISDHNEFGMSSDDISRIATEQADDLIDALEKQL